jgi:hypothetical protein
VWIGGQVAVIGYVSWMQPFVLGIGLAILGLAYISDRGSRLSGRPDAIDGIRAALASRLAELEKSAQRGRLAQQH